MRPEEYQFFVDFVSRRLGHELGPDKQYLVESRIQQFLRPELFAGLGDLIANLKIGSDQCLERKVIDALTVNETFFFRDETPFQFLRNVILPQIKQQAAKKISPDHSLKVWSAACSSGQEAYSIAMLLYEDGFASAPWVPSIVATDVCSWAIDQGRKGTYSDFEVGRGLGEQRKLEHFVHQGDCWGIKPRLKDMVQFAHFNLLEKFPPQAPFDVIFCRNVLIYFDVSNKKKVLETIANSLKPHGWLILGGTETAMGLCDRFVQPKGAATAVYQLKR